jgi:hypothetical protein
MRQGKPRLCVTVSHLHVRLKSHIVWEQANGPVPHGHLLVHLDGDTLNCDLDNLAVVKNHVANQRTLTEAVGYGDPEAARAWLNLRKLECRLVRARIGHSPRRKAAKGGKG